METIDQLKELEQKVTLGLQEVYRKMAVFKKINSPLIVFRNEKIVAIDPENMLSTTSAKKS